MSGKEAEIYATAEYYKSVEYRGTTEETVRLHHASKLFDTAEMLLGKSKLYTSLGPEIYKRLADLNSLCPELDVSVFDEPRPKQVVKAIPFERKLPSDFNDIFDAKVPDHPDYISMNEYEACLDELHNYLKQLSNLIFNSDSIFDFPHKNVKIDIFKGHTLPQSILDKAIYIQNQGGIKSLNTKIDKSTETLEKIKKNWINCDYLLNEENMEDARLREQFKEKWTLKPFEKMCEIFRTNSRKYRKLIQKAKFANNTVHKAFNKYASAMEYLSLDQTIIQAACLARVNGKCQHFSDIQKIRNCNKFLHKSYAKINLITSQFETVRINLKKQFSYARNSGNIDSVDAAAMKKVEQFLIEIKNNFHYIKINRDVVESLKKKMINGIMEEKNQGVDHIPIEKDNNKSDTNDIDKILIDYLIEAYDHYIQLDNDVKGANLFYDNLVELLTDFQKEVSDICSARRNEKEALLLFLAGETLA